MNPTDCLTEEAALDLSRNPGAGRSPAHASAATKIVVVLGMHRSGTSLLANLLNLLGVDLGENLLAADGNNPAGYWEQNQIILSQDALLEQLGRRWIGLAGTVPFPTDWWKLPAIRPFKEQLSGIVRAEIAQAKGLWGFKDPRTSRLLPLWQEIFQELNLEPVYLLSVREPSAVVESVMKRDEIPGSRAELLWLLHNLDAIRDAGDRLRLIVDYDRWFTHPREQAESVRRALELPGAITDDLLATLRERIRPELRRCKTAPRLTLPFVAETYALLQRGAADGALPAELPQLDREVRRALALTEPWSSVVNELTRPPNGPQFSFVEHFTAARLESLG